MNLFDIKWQESCNISFNSHWSKFMYLSKLKFSSAIFLPLISLQVSAAVYCPAISEQNLKNREFLYDSEKMKEHQIQFAQNNMRLFCEKNMTLRYLRINKVVDTKQCLENSLSDLHKLVQNFEKTQSPWHLSLVPRLEMKTLAALRYYAFDETFENVKIYDQILPTQLPNYFQTINKNIEQLTINNKAADVSAKSNIKKFCYGETLLSRKSCADQMMLVKEKMAPKGPYTDMTDRNLWKRVLTTTNYDRGLIEANKIISQNINSDNLNSDVFSDLSQGFINAGSSKSEAIRMTLDILGIMSNHGPNISHYLSSVVNMEQYDKKTQSVPLITKGNLIARIGSVMPYIDYHRMNIKAKLYSYPKNIITDCDNYKSYHFWMAAYLAYSLVVDDGFAPRDAAASAFLSEKIYQLYRDVASDGYQSGAVSGIFQYQPYDPTHQVIRMDLAYAAAGAVHGAFLAMKRQPPIIDVNEILIELLKASYPVEIDKVDDSVYKKGFFSSLLTDIFGADPDKIKKYLKWKMMFQPDVAFNIAEKNANWSN